MRAPVDINRLVNSTWFFRGVQLSDVWAQSRGYWRRALSSSVGVVFFLLHILFIYL